MHAGVVITKDPVVDYVPLYVNDGNITTQFVMTTLEDLGLLKMDFLGLRTLTVISDTIKLVESGRGIVVEIDKEMNDPEVFKFWQSGNSAGIFQFESARNDEFYEGIKTGLFGRYYSGSVFIQTADLWIRYRGILKTN